MEPRIATLLGDLPLERPSSDPPWLPPPPLSAAAPRKPHPVEPTTAIDQHSHSSASSLLAQSHHLQSPGQHVGLQRQKPNAPIGNVLNAVTPFSGRLSDLLLDPSQQQVPKRKREDEPVAPSMPAGPENSLLTLPMPLQQQKKSAKRPRIPPLLQGLHQVPPQAQSTLFPPITSESGAFGRDIGEGVGLRATGGAKGAQEQPSDVPPATAESNTAASPKQTLGKDGPKATSVVSTSDKENPAATKAATAKTKEMRKRNRWSDQETKDLLVGVSRFGIGSWKKILQCPDFTFHQRTAVDLKDRFRTCCPGEGLKPRKPKRNSDAQPEASQITTTSQATASMSSNGDSMIQDTPPSTNTLRKNRGDSHRKGPAELREMGIHGSFTRTNRRERRAFTEKDDENLLKGFERYSSYWHLMRDDEELGFSTRQPTDLRDRFRIRYPERFAKAGYKLKPKDERMLKEKSTRKDSDAVGGSSQNPTSSITTGGAASFSTVKTTDCTTADTSFTSLPSSTPSTSLLPLALRESFLTSFAGPLKDFDLASEQDADADGDPDRTRSPPITLSRNILEWVDAHPSQLLPGATLPSLATLASDAPLSVLNSAADGIHINPSLTLNLPMALLNSGIVPTQERTPVSSQNHSRAASQHTAGAVITSSSALVPTPAAAKHAAALLRTPNLPTIVFPQVPASSARSAVHNLPPPTDLLSGLEQEGYVVEEGGKAAAPRQGVLTIERGLLRDDGGG